jgi:hypothetical protein
MPESTPQPVACTLTTKQAAFQALEWVDLQGRATAVSEIDGGVRIMLPATLADSVEDLASRERACCTFLNIETAIEADQLKVEITSDNPQALPVIEALAGLRQL